MQAQPYRGGQGPAGQSLTAMLAGRPRFMAHPMDLQRQLQSGRPPQGLADMIAQLVAYRTRPITRQSYTGGQ